MLNYQRRFFLLCLVCGVLGGGSKGNIISPVVVEAPVRVSPAVPENVKGVWLTTLSGLDWPTPASSDEPSDERRIALQKQALIDKLDNLVSLGVNTIFFR